MANLVRGYWDCQYCSEKGISGDKRECPGCGKARDESVKFYMKQTNDYLSKEEAAKKTGRPDWFCEYCHSYNPDSADICESCGAPREGTTKNYHEMQQMKAQKAAQKAADAAEAAKAYNGGGKKSRAGLWIALLVIAAIIGILIFACRPKKQDMTLQAIDWTREITIEQNQYIEQSDWTLPADAELLRKADEIHHYDTEYVVQDVLVTKSREVQDGYDVSYNDLGDGTFEEIKTPHYETEYYDEYEMQTVPVQVPVYQTKYYYMAWVWVEERTVTASGQSHDTYWPEMDLAEDEREGAHHETYRITVKNEKDKLYKYEVPEQLWSSMNPGDGMTIMTSNGRGTLLDDAGNTVAELREVQ